MQKPNVQALLLKNLRRKTLVATSGIKGLQESCCLLPRHQRAECTRIGVVVQLRDILVNFTLYHADMRMAAIGKIRFPNIMNLEEI